MAGGAAVAGAGSAVAAGARMAPGAARAAIGGGGTAARSASALASGAKSAYQTGAAASGASGVRAAGAGLASVAKAGASAVGQRVASGAKAVKDHAASFVADAAEPASPSAFASGSAAEGNVSSPSAAEPAWAQRMRRKQQVTQAATTAAHVLRSGDHAGGGASPSLRDSSNP
ncbi:hypothetical protein D3C71_1462360 [compost metagenome]